MRAETNPAAYGVGQDVRPGPLGPSTLVAHTRCGTRTSRSHNSTPWCPPASKELRGDRHHRLDDMEPTIPPGYGSDPARSNRSDASTTASSWAARRASSHGTARNRIGVARDACATSRRSGASTAPIFG